MLTSLPSLPTQKSFNNLITVYFETTICLGSHLFSEHWLVLNGASTLMEGNNIFCAFTLDQVKYAALNKLVFNSRDSYNLHNLLFLIFSWNKIWRQPPQIGWNRPVRWSTCRSTRFQVYHIPSYLPDYRISKHHLPQQRWHLRNALDSVPISRQRISLEKGYHEFQRPQ